MSLGGVQVSSGDVTTHHAHGPADPSAQPDAIDSTIDSSCGELTKIKSKRGILFRLWAAWIARGLRAGSCMGSRKALVLPLLEEITSF